MFREEAIWINNALAKIKPLQDNNLVANLGSSTAYFREVIQPHIQQYLMQPLANNGWNIINIDLKQEDGVDVVADVTKIDFSQKIQPAGLTICTNMLEHVEDINLVVKNLIKVTTKGGYILLTVPYKYKKHLDPIDNMFRPTPNEIISLFKDVATEVIDKQVIVIHDKSYYHKKKSKFPIWGNREIIAYHLGIRHKVSGVLLQLK